MFNKLEGIAVISLGAGVQSSALALMAAHGEFEPMPEAAIFADTQAEPEHVYDWVDWLSKKLPFPLYTVTTGDLTTDSTTPRMTIDGERTYLKPSLPVYVLSQDGSVGMAIRQCTADYKIKPVHKKIRELFGKEKVCQWMGISWDEIQRMRDSRVKNIENRYPLVEKKITRDNCVQWMLKNGYPRPPRSACVYCPYHSNREWLRIKNEDQTAFEKAVRYEKKLQSAYAATTALDGTPYLHKSLRPLGDVDFEDRSGQIEWGFADDCDGMCGV